ncbi:hypothetical protein [Luteibacter sp. 329MFSha]|uniref:hypothetical protein n=1 Tax=Luteibacter sp. 329MFSha TaxID=1798239 RepID=UPI0008B380D5|nr:hypothetical protein [Luteibacter sp. 329MFSha]SEV96562.1 hypothetical protein SAMN04515660_1361 [Luteibacter sp. 329MFSha]
MHDLLFTRRHVQGCIERLSGVASVSELRKWVNGLNRPGADRLIKLWEVVILDALARLGPIRHEVPLSDGQKPDFSMDLTVSGKKFEVIGDITCVSDVGLDGKNPVDFFCEQLVRVARKKGVNPDRLAVRVHGQTVGPYRDAAMVLSLPSKGNVPALVKSELGQFLTNAGKNPATATSIEIRRPDAELTVSYNPAQMWFSLSRPSYEVSYSIDRNPLASALKSKADQLRAAPEDGVRIVVVCDGDCKTLKEHSPMGGHFSTAAIVEHFLAQRSTVDAVLLLPVVESYRNGVSTVSIHPQLFYRRPTKDQRRPPMDEELGAALLKHLQAMVENIPRPCISATNAVHRLNKDNLLFGIHGGITISGNKVKISSRQVLETLAGIPSRGVTPLDSSPGDPPPPPNWQQDFLRFLHRGQMIKTVTVVPGEGRDDDDLEIEFGQPDPAISPFRMPAVADSGPEEIRE